MRIPCAIIVHVDETKRRYLGVAQLVARYLGVVEAASSSLVTQTKSRKHSAFGIFCYILNISSIPSASIIFRHLP